MSVDLNGGSALKKRASSRQTVASFIEKHSLDKSKSEEKVDKETAAGAASSAARPRQSASLLGSLASAAHNHIFVILLTVRTLSCCFNLVWDCDEVYNFWEPLHFLLHGNGFQTWEYSPDYSLRSYLYLFFHALPIWPFQYFNLVSKITQFYFLRFVFALVMSAIEAHLYYSLAALGRQAVKASPLAFSIGIPKYFVLFAMTNVGMFLSSTGFLPSTFGMYLATFAYSSLIRRHYAQAVFCIGLATLLGWPFVGLLGVPIVIDMCFFNINAKGFFKNGIVFVLYTAFFGLIIAIPMVAFDSYMFGKLVFAPFNIVKYNVFPSKNQGPDLYGREPFSYYIFNCILNFNVLFPLAVVNPLLLGLNYLIGEKKTSKFYAFASLGMYLWFLVFFTRPHKEERFLYPVYALVILNATVSLDLVCSLTRKIFNFSFLAKLSRGFTRILPALIFLVHFALCLARFLALFKNFSASMDVYHYLNHPDIKNYSPRIAKKELINVCTEKEWYRFPSNFFIPDPSLVDGKPQIWRMRFLESNFKGQLPGYFSESLELPLSTRYIDKLFNDENKEVRQRYIDLSQCDFLIDTDDKDSRAEQVIVSKEARNPATKWVDLVELPFLNSTLAERLTRYESLFKSFYIPFVYERRIQKKVFTRFKLKVRID